VKGQIPSIANKDGAKNKLKKPLLEEFEKKASAGKDYFGRCCLLVRSIK